MGTRTSHKPWQKKKKSGGGPPKEPPPPPLDRLPDQAVTPPGTGFDKITGRLTKAGLPLGNVLKPAFVPLAPAEVNGRHKGELVVIFGSGRSLKVAKELEEELAGFATIGMNMSYIYIQSKYLVFQDKEMWDENRAELCGLQTHLFSRKDKVKAPINLFGASDANKSSLSKDYAKGLVVGTNTVFPAVNLAYVFGAKAIALVGVELRDATHFWSGNEYGEHPFLKKKRRYWRGKKDFPAAPIVRRILAEMGHRLRAEGIEYYNCSASSAVKEWPFAELRELLDKYPSPGLQAGGARNSL